MVEIRVNGAVREVAEGVTVAGLLGSLGLPAVGIAVAVDGAVCPRARYDGTVLADGAVVEILTAVQGG